MNTINKFAISGLVALLLPATSALADDAAGWVTIDNHHGYVTYLRRPVEQSTTVGIFRSGKGLGHTGANTRRTETNTPQPRLGLREITTSQGTVSYFAPAE